MSASDSSLKVWVLTEEYNAYDQYGEYFCEVFASKPSAQQLMTLEVPQHRLRHVLNGGGRKGDEDHWFNLKEIAAKLGGNK